jgi:hypothetical protein
MTTAQGINKITSIEKQAALGSPASGAGGFVLSRRTSVFSAPRDTYESDVIVTHQQSTGISYGMKKPAGKLDSLLSNETYELLFAAILRADFAAVTPYAAGIDVTAQAAAPQFADASGGFLTAGLKVGHVVRWTGFAGSPGTGNNSKNFWITALTATDMTGVFLNGDAVSADAAGDSVTCTVVGQTTKAPTTGHTNDYFTVEEFYADLVRSETYTDTRVNNIAVGLPASGNATFSADFIALGRTLGAAQVLTSPTEPTFREMAAVNGKIYVNGAAVGDCTGVQFTIDGSGAVDGPVTGSNSGIDVSRGRIKVSGSFSAFFDSTTIQALYDAETTVSLMTVVTEDETATSAFMGFTLGAIKMTDDAPDDGEKAIMRTYPFTAEYNSAGGAALAWDATILTVQDSQLS